MTSIPAGFQKLEVVSPFIETNGPLYGKLVPGGAVFGMQVAKQHCNRGNKLHGGMVCTIADIAIGHNIAAALGADLEAQPETSNPEAVSGPPGVPMTTVSMSTDYTGSANLGDWVEVHVDVHRVGGSLAFANAYLSCADQRIARVSAVFKLLRK